MDAHLTDETLAQFVERSLSGEERERAEAHLASCERCLEIALVVRDVSPARPIRIWIGGIAAAAALLAIGLFVATSGAPSTASRLDLEAFVRAQKDAAASSNALWKTTLTSWEDLATVPVASLDSEEQRLLIRTMEKRPWAEEKLSPGAREFVKRTFEERIRSTLSGPARVPSADVAWREISQEAESIKALAQTRELHPWVLRRFVDRCGELIAVMDDREFDDQLRRRGVTRHQVVQRLRDLVSE